MYVFKSLSLMAENSLGGFGREEKRIKENQKAGDRKSRGWEEKAETQTSIY